MKTEKSKKHHFTGKSLSKALMVLQCVLLLIMAALVSTMIYEIEALQGTARVINYAGIVRGTTQREIKLELAGESNEELVSYIDEILKGLKYGGGKFELVCIDDPEYRSCLNEQIDYWIKLKTEINDVWKYGHMQSSLLDMSEDYFTLSNSTVAAAEAYSQSIATIISKLEFATVIVIVLLIAIMLLRTYEAFRVRRRNHQLERKAFTDQHTGLPNKGKCEEFFTNDDLLQRSIACVVLDMNNLKSANDTFGHSIGDQLIANFARLLRKAVPARNFVGRYGGDEFMAVIYDTTRDETEAILEKLNQDVNDFNGKIHGTNSEMEVSYACGYALSEDYPGCSFRVLFDNADRNMYENKLKEEGHR